MCIYIYNLQGSDLGTEVTTITTSDGQNVQVVIKSVERRTHHQPTLTSAIPSADVNSVRSVTTSDGTNLVRIIIKIIC